MAGRRAQPAGRDPEAQPDDLEQYDHLQRGGAGEDRQALLGRKSQEEWDEYHWGMRGHEEFGHAWHQGQGWQPGAGGGVIN